MTNENSTRNFTPEVFIPVGSVIVPITEELFSVRYDQFMTFHFLEDSDGDALHAYGHKDKKRFANAVNAYDFYSTGETFEDSNYKPEDVEHTWGVAYARPDDLDDWKYLVVPEDTPNAVPVTRLPR